MCARSTPRASADERPGPARAPARPEPGGAGAASPRREADARGAAPFGLERCGHHWQHIEIRYETRIRQFAKTKNVIVIEFRHVLSDIPLWDAENPWVCLVCFWRLIALKFRQPGPLAMTPSQVESSHRVCQALRYSVQAVTEVVQANLEDLPPALGDTALDIQERLTGAIRIFELVAKGD